MSPKKAAPAVRGCALCKHPDRAVFDEAIVKGTPVEQIAVGWTLPLGSVRRHRSHTLASATPGGEPIAPAVEAVERAHTSRPRAAPPRPRAAASASPAPASTSSSTDDTVIRVLAQIETVLGEIQADPEATVASKLSALRAATGAANLLARVRGEAGANVTEAVLVRHPIFQRVVATLTKALEPWPEAMAAVASTLEELDR